MAGSAGDTFKGAAGGAALGASVGSVVPGVGTAIGAGIGALGGGLLSYFGGSDENDQQKQFLQQYRDQILQRQAPQAGPASMAATSGFRANQQNHIGRLEAIASGQGPSLAGEQLKQANERNVANQLSVAQSGRGNPALANLVAANNIGQLGQSTAQQSAIARIAEQQMALGQLGGAIQGGRGLDEQTAQFNAQQQNFRDQANLEAKLRTMGLNDEAIASIMRQQTTVNNIPTLGDQLLAGGIGALGMYAGQRGGGAAAARPA